MRWIVHPSPSSTCCLSRSRSRADRGAVIGGSVAFDAQEISSGPLWIHHRQIDEEPGRSYLMLDIVSQGPQPGGDRFLERRIGLLAAGLGNVDHSMLRVLQEGL